MINILEKAEKQLAKIEHQKRTWKSQFYREQEIWSEIAMNLNCPDEDSEFWGLVMDLYNKKYRNNES